MTHEETRDMVFKSGVLNGTISLYLTDKEMGCLGLIMGEGLAGAVERFPELEGEFRRFSERIARYLIWVNQLDQAAARFDAVGENKEEGR